MSLNRKGKLLNEMFIVSVPIKRSLLFMPQMPQLIHPLLRMRIKVNIYLAQTP